MAIFNSYVSYYQRVLRMRPPHPQVVPRKWPGAGTFELRLSTVMLVVDETGLRATGWQGPSKGPRDGSNV